MTDIKRLGLGCMGMNFSNRERSIDTIHMALDRGITLFNTGDFYGNGGESELVLGEALKDVPRDSYFVSVKFGMLPKLGGGLYGIDVDPWHVKSYLLYSLKRLGLEYIDLYEPARLDETVPVEDIVGVLSELVQEGYVRHIGLSQVRVESLRKASAIHPIHTVEMEYSLADRSIETEMIGTAKELDTEVLAFGVLSHGLISERSLEGTVTSRFMCPEDYNANLELVRALKLIADEKGISVSNLALLWTLAKYDHVSALVGTTSKEHLSESIDALKTELTTEDIKRIEAAFPIEKVKGMGMRAFTFRNGRFVK